MHRNYLNFYINPTGKTRLRLGWCKIANLWAHSMHSDLGAALPFGDGSSIAHPVPQANSKIYN